MNSGIDDLETASGSMSSGINSDREHKHRLLSFVRRGGRLTSGQERALKELAPEYLINPPRGEGVTSIAPGSETDPAVWFGRNAALTIEIGSGQGHQITTAAQKHPERDYLALEVFIGGIARTMVLAEQKNVHNLRLIEANAPEVLENLLPAGCAQEIWIFFPDPWHKARHNKRRLINEQFTKTLAHTLDVGGVVRLATDWEEYAVQMREVLDAASGFKRDFTGDWAPRFTGRVLTAFEQKGQKAGRNIYDLAYKRV